MAALGGVSVMVKKNIDPKLPQSPVQFDSFAQSYALATQTKTTLLLRHDSPLLEVEKLLSFDNHPLTS